MPRKPAAAAGTVAARRGRARKPGNTSNARGPNRRRMTVSTVIPHESADSRSTSGPVLGLGMVDNKTIMPTLQNVTSSSSSSVFASSTASPFPTQVATNSTSSSSTAASLARQHRREQAFKSMRDHVQERALYFQRLSASVPLLEAKLQELQTALHAYSSREDIKLYRVRLRETRLLKRLIRDIRDQKEEKQYLSQVRPFIDADNALVASTALMSTAASRAGPSAALSVAGDAPTTTAVDDADLASLVLLLPPEQLVVHDAATVGTEPSPSSAPPTVDRATPPSTFLPPSPSLLLQEPEEKTHTPASVTWAPMTPLVFTAPALLGLMQLQQQQEQQQPSSASSPLPPTLSPHHLAPAGPPAATMAPPPRRLMMTTEQVIANVSDISIDPSTTSDVSVLSYASAISMDQDSDDEDQHAGRQTASGGGRAKPPHGSAKAAAGSATKAAHRINNKTLSSSGDASCSSSSLLGGSVLPDADVLPSILQQRHELSEKWVATFTPSQIQPKYVNADLCSRCKRDMILLPFEGKRVCFRCKTWVEDFDSALNLGFGEDTQTTTTHQYDRPKHLTKFMKQWEKGIAGPPPKVYIDILRHYDNSRDTCVHDVKPTPIRDVLSQLGYKEWRSFAERISNRLQNIPVAQLCPTTIRAFSKLFALIQPVFIVVKERRYVPIFLFCERH